MGQPLLPFHLPQISMPPERRGVIYTKPWVVELLLNLAGYRAGTNLVDTLAVEPAVGEGAFLTAMVHRLIASSKVQARPFIDCARSILAYEIDPRSAEVARKRVSKALGDSGVSPDLAQDLATSWIRTGDYLFDAPTLPRADFVIGNPPYVRLEDIPEETIEFYRKMYPTMKGRADLYVAFFEAALRQLKAGGTCAYICADRWMLNQYGAELRRLVTSAFHVRTTIEMHDADAFDADVSAYPAITVISREPQGEKRSSRASPLRSPRWRPMLSALISIRKGVAARLSHRHPS